MIIDMFANGLVFEDPLAQVAWPRCGTLGLIESDDATHNAAPERDRHEPSFIINP